ncbi:hypothetical protein FF38_06060 [Lucilia cuprina]|uniref:Zinc finger PHD-type domain-containing protein n=1 Tax=Lucilia cuprina TaxID=7375 RepID=A0A0L0CM04_LUCCU|nr:hypothetical protein CVS40_3590 [Lucilia cuprina]KAI8126909.1 hypothetical protein CVS40_3130 [Lucilia cuprina]KNC23973.1 hypothetical protein FF38_07419 [Lucilia cuprina]KNC33301.1 hypothetical protein FF38_06060 [Lucilia cuprina]
MNYIICGLSCGKNVTKSTGGISCARCLKWFHISCVNVSVEQLNFLQKSKGKFLFECEECTSCNSEVSELREEVRKSNDSIHFKLDALLSKIGNYDAQLKELKDDITNCNQLIKYVDDTNYNKIKELEDKNEILQRRFNRPDIIINGLPRKDIKLCDIVLKIFNFLDVNVSFHDLNVCTYINNRKSVLVKFNSLLKRDAVMHSYFKKGKLMETDILKNNGEKRIYLNDHLTEKGGKLNRLCRDLRKDDTIAKFRILNSDLPRVKIHFKDATEKIFEYEECFKHFNFGKRQQEIQQSSAMEDSPVDNEISTTP